MCCLVVVAHPQVQPHLETERPEIVSHSIMLHAGRQVWAAARAGGVVRLGITAEMVSGLGLLPGKAFLDLAPEDSVLLPTRAFAMVEGPKGMLQLHFPLDGMLLHCNMNVQQDPGLLNSLAECVDRGWLVEVDIGVDSELEAEAELVALAHHDADPFAPRAIS